ncbi:MAG: transcriptional regulator [Hyphomicrobiales bacterium]|nr:transcriptional regulator [Hyphomicrobiales bacterium]
MRRTSFEHAECPIARSLDVIGDWWSLLIVRDAFGGKRKFGDFQKNLGIAKNILAARLRSLVSHGILTLEAAEDGSPYQEYGLTAKGRDLFYVLVALRQWGDRHLFETEDVAPELLDRQLHRPVGQLELHAADGRLLRPGDTMLRRRRCEALNGA